jgi:hypothetical protein
VPDWSGVDTWPCPLTSNGFANPVFTRYDVTGYAAALVGDPFLMRDGNHWYLFFEAWIGYGKICLATSENGLDWTFDRILINAGSHVSYPCVFRDGNDTYMVLESGATQSIPLYKAMNFPYDWVQVGTLATGRAFADPTILHWNDTWWMFVSRSANDVCYLYYSDALTGPWTEHPLSPVVTGTWCSRPAGHLVALTGSRLVRLAQDCNPTYGEGVRAFAVDTMTRTAYAEHQVAESPVLFRSGSGWNASGMHTCDLWWRDGVWMAAVDGLNTTGQWSIGFYWGRGAPGAVPGASSEAAWRVVPNPFRVGDEVRVLPASEVGARCDLLEIFDPAGRCLARFATNGENETPRFRWGDRLADGLGSTPGVYLLRASSGGRTIWRGKGIAVR